MRNKKTGKIREGEERERKEYCVDVWKEKRDGDDDDDDDKKKEREKRRREK